MPTSTCARVVLYKWDAVYILSTSKNLNFFRGKKHCSIPLLEEAREPQGVRAESGLRLSLVQLFSADEETEFQDGVDSYPQ